MVQINPVNVLGSLMGGLQARDTMQGMERRNALAQAAQTFGVGSPQFKSALAVADPVRAYAFDQGDRRMEIDQEQFGQTMGLREREFEAANADRQARLQIARQNAARQAAAIAAQMTAAERAREAEILDRALATATTAETAEDWDRIMTGFGDQGAQFVGQFERRDEIFAGVMGLTDALKARQGPEYRPATPEEAALYGATAGQIGRDGRFYVTPQPASTNVSVNTGDQGQRIGSIPAGFTAVPDPSNPSGFRMEPIPGGPAAAEVERDADAAALRKTRTERAGNTVIQDLGRALEVLEGHRVFTAGPGAVVARNVPGTPAAVLEQLVESVASNIGVDQLQQMRDSSPTGGALGQVPFQQQRRLEQLLGSLDITQPAPVLADNLKRVSNIYNDIVHGEGQGPQRFELSFDNQGRRIEANEPSRRSGRQPAGPSAQDIPPAPSWYDPGPGSVPWEEAWEFLPEGTRRQMLGNQ
jgi:hypothetical protein